MFRLVIFLLIITLSVMDEHYDCIIEKVVGHERTTYVMQGSIISCKRQCHGEKRCSVVFKTSEGYLCNLKKHDLQTVDQDDRDAKQSLAKAQHGQSSMYPKATSVMRIGREGESVEGESRKGGTVEGRTPGGGRSVIRKGTAQVGTGGGRGAVVERERTAKVGTVVERGRRAEKGGGGTGTVGRGRNGIARGERGGTMKVRREERVGGRTAGGGKGTATVGGGGDGIAEGDRGGTVAERAGVERGTVGGSGVGIVEEGGRKEKGGKLGSKRVGGRERRGRGGTVGGGGDGKARLEGEDTVKVGRERIGRGGTVRAGTLGRGRARGEGRAEGGNETGSVGDGGNEITSEEGGRTVGRGKGGGGRRTVGGEGDGIVGGKGRGTVKRGNRRAGGLARREGEGDGITRLGGGTMEVGTVGRERARGGGEEGGVTEGAPLKQLYHGQMPSSFAHSKEPWPCVCPDAIAKERVASASSSVLLLYDTTNLHPKLLLYTATQNKFMDLKAIVKLDNTADDLSLHECRLFWTQNDTMIKHSCLLSEKEHLVRGITDVKSVCGLFYVPEWKSIMCMDRLRNYKLRLQAYNLSGGSSKVIAILKAATRAVFETDPTTRSFYWVRNHLHVLHLTSKYKYNLRKLKIAYSSYLRSMDIDGETLAGVAYTYIVTGNLRYNTSSVYTLKNLKPETFLSLAIFSQQFFLATTHSVFIVNEAYDRLSVGTKVHQFASGVSFNQQFIRSTG